ncbi:MAG TPA: energy transducer TonB [Candidatus Acidoferrales bacterium]
MQSTTPGKNHQDCAGKETILGRCLVDGDSQATFLARRTRGKTFGVSLVIEISLLGLLVAAPLFNSTAKTPLQKNLQPQFAYFGDWREHHQIRRADPSTNLRRPQPQNTYAPILSSGVTVSVRHDAESDQLPISDFGGGDGAGIGLPTGIMIAPSIEPPSESPQIAKPAREEKRPVKISEGILQAQLISRIEPQYPRLAQQTRKEGTVQLRAIISRDGRIVSLEVISGHPLLVKAALDAVRRWTYRPTMLNGEPVEVETSITVIFKLH